ncbi:MAG: 2-dehydropantoate 2-reductase, partial [Betaproteobacteria bacterium]|nr:2-dehydropantoate 2-reductase [Betaproteobacteria bacterium]MBV9360388.1 2-dehydropantoate 2-reductase [Betaproteobacteria bacterium]
SPALSDIRQSVWSKLAQNLWTSTLCTLTQGSVREVQENPELKPIAARATEEARAIARALDVAIEQAPKRPSPSASAAAHKPSMLQDYERNRPMEVEAQLVAPLELARLQKVHTPTLDFLVPLVMAKASAKGLYTH